MTPALNWRKHRTGVSLPCRYCGKAAMCRDENNQPCHKVCAEAALTGSGARPSTQGSAA